WGRMLSKLSYARPKAQAPKEERKEVSLEQRAVQLYLKSGSLAAVSRELEVPLAQVKELAGTQWWVDEVSLTRRMEVAALDAGLTEILGSTLSQLRKRLETGEAYVAANGQIKYRPIKSADLCKIVDVVFDKRQLIRGM